MLYDVLQAAVTVIWCISMVVLFVRRRGDHVRRFPAAL
jgi:hypothetical protein